MVKRTNEEVNGYTIKGVFGIESFLRDQKGEWYRLDTEGAKEWNEIPDDLRDTQGGVFLCSILMLQNYTSPLPITDPDITAIITGKFGDS